LLHAFRTIAARRPNLRLLLVGEGSETPVLKRLAQEAGIA